MSRVDEALGRTRGGTALVAYVMAGYPRISDTPGIVRGLVRGGADVVELGLPFSDPIADGPVIQEAATASLASGTDPDAFLDVVRDIRAESDVPLILMTYSNILYRRGYGAFIKEASGAGIDGYILPDMPVEESGEYVAAARRNGSSAIFLASPNTSDERVRMIADTTAGFLYLVAVYGTTGASGGPRDYSLEAVRRIKGITGDSVPLGVGFGVSSPGDVRKYAGAGADAVIVGSAILGLIRKTPSERLEDAVAGFVSDLKAGAA